ncbi:4-alpha-glucanotransferase [Dyella mobilis]|uniref:4-alpha-glucanotransferase n=1 Tax=Dyella mobilis TaxID=1849582 RepID=A0ABS2KDJ6_9GAMM|nr:4-alpha-glucanotransferase [Dyella mobilis]MBM7128847.1 4-alpha-glucanotransferase [Dyella mobilis]GLQ99178.1 4-alpha-glucanotransferase [Dyella mobilis]
MTTLTLEARAHAAGIETHWVDAYGAAQELAGSTIESLLDAMRWPSTDASSWPRSSYHRHACPAGASSMVTADAGGTARLPLAPGHSLPAILRDETGTEHALRVDEQGCFQAPHRYGYYELHYGTGSLQLAVAPSRCYGVVDRMPADPPRSWGLATQVYSLRRDGDGGLGDSSAVADLARSVGRSGGDALAMSPMHAVKRTAAAYSPYTPSHRQFLDWVYADPAQVLGEQAVRDAFEQAGIAAEWERAQNTTLVDWPVAYALRRILWQQLYWHFELEPHGLHDDLEMFATRGGELLRTHARMVAREVLRTAQLNDPQSMSASAIPEAFRAEQAFEIFAQWLAARCWQKTQQIALEAGQHIGLIWDLAVGCDPAGSEAWAYRDCLLEGMELGAPPDAFNADGQSWGITTFSPWGLKASGFRPFIELLRANMHRGGGLRIDHVSSLYRLWVMPQGLAAQRGGYLRYPFEDLLRLLALESWRNQCVVIGEDLGTIPAGLRDTLAARGVLGTDVLLFMRNAEGDFLPPSQWRQQAVATTTTHDLPPLLGWRAALDIEQRARVQGWPDSLRLDRQKERQSSVEKLDLALLQWQQQRTTGIPGLGNQVCMDYVLDTPAQLALIPIEDVLGRSEQPNLPGTVHGYPNWRHRLPAASEQTLQSVLHRIDQRQPGARTS